MSVTMMIPIDMIPPPPMPWIERPASNSAKFFAAQQRAEPTVKKKTDSNKISRRPKISERAAMNGWQAALVRRYDVPVQKDCAAVPPRSLAIVFEGRQL